MIRDFVIIADIKAPNTAKAEAIIHAFMSPIVRHDPRFDADILTGASTSGGKTTIWDPKPGSLQVPVELAVKGPDHEEVVKEVCVKFKRVCPFMTGWHWSNRHVPLMEGRAPRPRGTHWKPKGRNKLGKG